LLSVATSASTNAAARGDENVVTINDSDGDRIVDTVDVDDYNDGILDVVEIAGNGLDVDSDKDGVPDRLDLDSDNDGILDWHESGAVFAIDFSELRVVSGRLVGSVGVNGLHDSLETAVDSGVVRYTLSNLDGPMDDLPDVIDLDSDNDGIPDLIEAGVDPSFDSDGDARIDISSGSVGLDGIADRIQRTNDESCCDVNGDGIDDIVPRNTDSADYPDFRDLDSDNDGVFDLVEAGGSDFDRDGLVDNFFDSPVLDGMDDALLAIPLKGSDNNGNGVTDYLDEFEQAGNSGPDNKEDNVGGTTGNGEVNATENKGEPAGGTDSGSTTGEGKQPARRPGEDIVKDTPKDDDPDAAGDPIETGLNAAGCSVQSTGIDLVLLLLSVLSITILGWRYTVRRIAFGAK